MPHPHPQPHTRNAVLTLHGTPVNAAVSEVPADSVIAIDYSSHPKPPDGRVCGLTVCYDVQVEDYDSMRWSVVGPVVLVNLVAACRARWLRIDSDVFLIFSAIVEDVPLRPDQHLGPDRLEGGPGELRKLPSNGKEGTLILGPAEGAGLACGTSDGSHWVSVQPLRTLGDLCMTQATINGPAVLIAPCATNTSGTTSWFIPSVRVQSRSPQERTAMSGLEVLRSKASCSARSGKPAAA